jgi:hypothetical protein
MQGDWPWVPPLFGANPIGSMSVLPINTPNAQSSTAMSSSFGKLISRQPVLLLQD